MQAKVNLSGWSFFTSTACMHIQIVQSARTVWINVYLAYASFSCFWCSFARNWCSCSHFTKILKYIIVSVIAQNIFLLMSYANIISLISLLHFNINILSVNESIFRKIYASYLRSKARHRDWIKIHLAQTRYICIIIDIAKKTKMTRPIQMHTYGDAETTRSTYTM